MWWRFRKHKLAVGGTLVLIAFYLVALFADFFAYADPQESEAQRSLMAPQQIHWFDEGRFSPYVYALKGTRDPLTFKRVYVPDTSTKIPVTFFGRGEPYELLGFIPTDRHLFGRRRRQGGRVAVPAGNGHAGTRPVVAAHVRDADVDDDRPGQRGAEPRAGRRPGRHLRLFRRR